MIAEVSREAVLAAIAEFERAGVAATLSWHGFGPATKYMLEHDGLEIPSKAIMGVAVGYEFGEGLRPRDFSGGVEHSARQLVRLGFTVRRGRSRLTLDDVAIPRRLALRSTAAELRLYVVRPTNARTVEACKRHGFGALLSPLSARKLASGRYKLDDLSGHTQPQGLPYVLDNGAWTCSEAGVPWQPDPFLRLVERLGPGLGDGWVVLPDIVGAGERSLAFSVDFHARRRGELAGLNLALAVQDGMTPDLVRPVLRELGCTVIFVGGSAGPRTPNWKWKTLHEWTLLGLELGLRVHVGRVNGERRAKLCGDLGATSIDGRAVTMYAVNATKMARACDGDEQPAAGPRVHDARLASKTRGFELALGGQQP